MADFKSPPQKLALKPILSKFKVPEKAKKKILKSQNKKNIISKNTDRKQQVKSEVKESFPCPLCLKPFKDELSQFSHMKICATKKSVTMKQLLDAKRLQERQAEERKALGLLATPAIPERKKIFRSRNYVSFILKIYYNLRNLVLFHCSLYNNDRCYGKSST